MRILILGGTVFLSRAVAEAALASGWNVTCLARGTQGGPPDGCGFVRADRDDAEAYAEVGGDWDVVVDITSEPAHARRAVTRLGSRATRWIYVSSCSVYADQGVPGQDEFAAILPAYDGDGPAPREQYGEAKVACEEAVAVLGERSLIIRPGLICGPGDGSDRFGYWPARLAQGGTVLVPAIQSAATQTIDVRDLAEWIVDAARTGTSGIYNALGPSVAFGDLIDEIADVAGFSGELRWVDPDWLRDRGVAYWAGPDSLPHWLPAGFEGFAARSVDAARRSGLVWRAVRDTIHDVLRDEVARGLTRERRSGLTPTTEQRLLEELRAKCRPGGKQVHAPSTSTTGSCSTGKLTERAMKQAEAAS